ncbi:MAG: hypothetical protein Q9207_003617 [Kuettlingeria erythrocarpa]
MAGNLKDDSFAKALNALEILAKILPSLRYSEYLQVCKVINREIEALVGTEGSVLAENHCLSYLRRLITVRTILDARGMTYDTKGINGVMASLLSPITSRCEESAQKAVCPELEISTGSKRASSMMEEPHAMATDVDASAAVKKQKLAPGKTESWTVPVKSYTVSGKLHKSVGAEYFAFGWDPQLKKFHVRKGSTECLQIPYEAAGIVALHFHSGNTIHDDHYVRLTPIVSRLLTDPKHGVVHFRLADPGAVQALKEHMQPMENAIFHSVESERIDYAYYTMEDLHEQYQKTPLATA